MKKIKNRAYSALILAALLIAGLAVYAVRFKADSEAWAMFHGNQGIYSGGVLDTGSVLDRGGVLLASAGGGTYRYADDASVRSACLHAVGDYTGNIGTGVVTALASDLAGYSILNGTYSRDGSGNELTLTIDSSVNAAARNALWGRKGAVLVMNYKTGEILCMVSSPDYDPVNPPDLTQPQYEGVFLNRAISAAYTPGSVFKTVTLAAAIENIPDLKTRSFSCSGSVITGGEIINCSGTHGRQTIEQAYANSCNCAFAELSLELGGETLKAYAESLGLTSSHAISGIETAAGSFTAQPDDSAELAWSGIGQSVTLVSPFAMLRLTSAIAGGGLLTEPVLVENNGLSLAGSNISRLLAAGTASELIDFMSYNVTYSYGSGTFGGLDVCAKTGTAEVGDGASHAWVTGFVRDTKNPLAFVVIVENGGSGISGAAPVANAALQACIGAS